MKPELERVMGLLGLDTIGVGGQAATPGDHSLRVREDGRPQTGQTGAPPAVSASPGGSPVLPGGNSLGLMSGPVSKSVLSAFFSALVPDMPPHVFEAFSNAMNKRLVLSVIDKVGLPPPAPGGKGYGSTGSASASSGQDWLASASAMADKLIKEVPLGRDLRLSENVHKDLRALYAASLQGPDAAARAAEELRASFLRSLAEFCRDILARDGSAEGERLREQLRRGHEKALEALRARGYEYDQGVENAREEAQRKGLALAAMKSASEETARSRGETDGAVACDEASRGGCSDLAVLSSGQESKDGEQAPFDEENQAHEEDDEPGDLGVARTRRKRSIEGGAASALPEGAGESAAGPGDAGMGGSLLAACRTCSSGPLTSYDTVCSIQSVINDSDAIDAIVAVLIQYAGLLDQTLLTMVQDFDESNNQLRDYGQILEKLGNLSSAVSDDSYFNLSPQGVDVNIILEGKPTLAPQMQGQTVSLQQAICAYGLGVGVKAATDSGGGTTGSLCDNSTAQGQYSWIKGSQANTILSALRGQNEQASTLSQTSIFRLQDLSGKRSAATDAQSTVSKTKQSTISRQIQNLF